MRLARIPPIVSAIPGGAGGKVAALAAAFGAALMFVAKVGAFQSTPATAHPLVGRAVLEFRASEGDPLNMPTAVAVAPDGRVLVVDGVNDRVVEFSRDGAVTRTFVEGGGRPFHQPVGAKADVDGRVWIADTGNARVVVLDAGGETDRVIDLSGVLEGRVPDVTDLAFAASGAHLWLADNDDHVLLRYDLERGEVEVVGRPGEALAEFRFPFALASRENGDVLITDVLNGRVQVLNDQGIPTRALGAYGVDLGQFHRPKGIAIDDRGAIWVSDTTTNVLQAFTSDGRYIGVLRDANGEPWKFEHPMGLAFDGDGALYVVELSANRVQKLVIEGARLPGLRRAAAPRQRDVPGGRQGRTCTTCHLEWLAPLADGMATELIDPPPNPPEAPSVSRPAACLGCHDGGVGDSRLDVWTLHGHRVGVAPPAEITVPDYLPLVDGKIECRTCHSAHGRATVVSGVAEAVFLRIEESPIELCVACHSQRAASTHGHPLGPMDRPLPETLLEHGSLLSAGENQVTCLVCHRAHGSSEDLLLTISPDRNELCLTCHEGQRPGKFRDVEREPHPLSAVLSPQQAEVVRQAGREIGPDGQIICLSCHKMHDAAEDRYALAFPLRDSDACLRCHSEKQAMLASTHDLRAEHADEANLFGLTVADAGPCSACHMFHRYVRLPTDGVALDPAGECVTCHRDGGLASSRMLGEVNHPQARCVQCHDPHDPSTGAYLRDQPQGLCVSCHTEQIVMEGGPHDSISSDDAVAWPAESREKHDACLACHRPHGTAATGLFRVPPVAGAAQEEAACLACHADAAQQADSPHALQHPRVVDRPAVPLGEPLRATDDGHWRIGCTSCHDPHRDWRESEFLVRGVGMTESEQICLECHPQLVSIHSIGPAKERLREWGFEAEACRPCHQVHAAPSSVEPRYLWPVSLSDFPRPPESVSVQDDYCTTCHRRGGPVAPPEIASHPDVVMFNPIAPGEPGYFPLFNERGEEDPGGKIACRTCHLTHGRLEAAVLPAQLSALRPRELRARKFHIRTFEQPTVCNTCHGAGALRRFMYFHDPARRGGELEARVITP